MKKKVISLLLVFALCLSFSTVVFADSEHQEELQFYQVGMGRMSIVEPRTTNTDELFLSGFRTIYPNYGVNYEHNSSLTQPTGYIMGQGQYADFNVGYASFADVGCELAAVYNALRAVSKSPYLPSIIRSFESLGYVMNNGYWGSDPFAIASYLNSQGVSYSIYKEQNNYSNFKNAVESTGNNASAYIVSFWVDSLETQLHTVMFRVNSSGSIMCYNRYNSSTSVTYYDSLDELRQEGDMNYRFSVGYVIP